MAAQHRATTRKTQPAAPLSPAVAAARQQRMAALKARHAGATLRSDAADIRRLARVARLKALHGGSAAD